jgi:phosphoribosylaminoimidazole-succinocarboxamide synthase
MPTYKVLEMSNDLPIRTDKPIHSGKVRSVYWLTAADSKRLIKEKNYDCPADAELGIMVISDRISAFEIIWKGEAGMNGVPGKGAALNAISNHWFNLFREKGLADNHILDTPHPLVWIVQKARPVMVEAIARNYITGSMWRSYTKGEREFCGIPVAEGLEKDTKLPELLITPSTKGILRGIPSIPEIDDVNITRSDIENNFEAFKFQSKEDIAHYEKLLIDGFRLIEAELDKIGQIFVDTKFEFGYVKDASGSDKLIYMDEVGTPDSSRLWDKKQFAEGKVVENSKEVFRKALMAHFPDADILTNKERMDERVELGKELLPQSLLQTVSDTYTDIAKKITGEDIVITDNPKGDIITILKEQYGLVD